MIRIERLSVRYGAKPALQEVSLTVPRGRVLAIVGPSGCGKSSLLAALNRMTDLVPGARVTGRVWLEGEEVLGGGVPPALLRRRVGMIFQRPNPFPMSIRRNIELGLKEHGVRDRRERARIVERALRDVGLWDEVADRLDRPATELSGGQQQRLCIARALALEPRVLLMDEPCSALDPFATEVIERLIARLRGRYTLVVVTHDLAQAKRVADEVAVFWLRDGAGVLLEHGPAERLFREARDPTASAYLAGARG